MWGNLQTGVWDRSYGSGPNGDGHGIVWVWAFENPHPGKRIRALHFKAESQGLLFICGMTLYHGHLHPLQYERLQLYRFSLPEGASASADDWDVNVDLGVVARKYTLPAFSPDAWLHSPDPRVSPTPAPLSPPCLCAEITASLEATLILRERATGHTAEFDLSETSRVARARVELLHAHKTWLHGKVIDRATLRPTPARLAFRSLEGRYLPPYGHRYEINTGWFQDYGADVVAAGSPFAYVNGTFQVELPVGEVLVEIAKGYEYGLTRRRLRIEPGQRELTLEVARQFDLRSRGWMTADVHVHFLSPSTAVLEGQAEGLNFINLLAAQWGDLFTNVGDLAQGASRRKTARPPFGWAPKTASTSWDTWRSCAGRESRCIPCPPRGRRKATSAIPCGPAWPTGATKTVPAAASTSPCTTRIPPQNSPPTSRSER